MIKKIKLLINKLIKTGFFSIYLSTICSKVVTLLGGILIVRLLSQEDYGIYTLVLNAISMLCIFGDCGASGATLQYAIETENKPEKQKGFFILGLKMVLFSSLLSSILILTSPFFYPYQSNIVKQLTVIMFAVPILTTLINYIGIILRVKKENNKYSLYQVLTTIAHYLVVIFLTIIIGLKGSLIAQYFYNIIIFIVGIIFIKKYYNLKNAEKISKKEIKGFLKIGLGTQLNNTLNGLLYTIDIFILSVMSMQATDVSIYKVATIIPTALVFLPQCLSIYIFPYFISHNKDADWIKINIKKIIKYISPFYGSITIIAILLSKFIIRVLYGAEYLDATVPFIILMIGFFFVATIKNLFGNIIYSLHKVWFSVWLNIISMIINVILDVIFIKIFGFIGVAISTMIINVFTSIASIIYFNICIKKIEKITNVK